MNFDENTDIVIVTSHFSEDLNWLNQSPFPVIVSTNNNCFRMNFTGNVTLDEACRAHINIGREASAYLRFIVNYYNKLPKHIAFIHGHEHAWHQRFPGSLFEAIRRAKCDHYDFISLNLHHSPSDLLVPGNMYFEAAKHIWPLLFQPHVGKPYPEAIKRMDLGAQFIVSRNAIKKYPLDVWKGWLHATSTPGLLHHHYEKLIAWSFEYSWHALFGENFEYEEDENQYLHNRFHDS